MSKISIFNTDFAIASKHEKLTQDAAKFIITNRNVLLSSGQMKDIFNTRPLISLPVNLIFSNMLLEGKENIFAPIYLGKTKTVPEILTIPSFTMDLKQTKEASVLSTFPEFKDKIVLNLTHLLKIQDASSFRAPDINEVHSLYVRGLLTASYNDFKGNFWLTPALLTYITKTYSMIISSIIARNYNLDFTERSVVATILATFLINRMVSEYDPDMVKNLLGQCSFLGNRVEVRDIATQVFEISGNNLNVANMCEAIQTVTKVDRLSTFDMSVLYRSLSSLGEDFVNSNIAIEYPPYWVHQVIRALSNVKTSLQYQMKQHGKLMEEGKQFVVNLNASSSFIKQLDR